MTNVKHTGWRGINFVFLKVKAVWDFETLRTSILLSFENRFWRLLHSQDFLFYKVFKARFFPSCSIMDYGVKTTRSFAWQSILKARHVIAAGSSWRIGDGRSVLIRGDRWLPGPHCNNILSPQKHFPLNTKVCALMTENGTSWDEERIRSEFLPFEA